MVRLEIVAGVIFFASVAVGADRPNVLFIGLDDLNDWTGCLGGHPQAKTPNIDRLAGSGVIFTNAHCAAPSCNPSRTALFTGRAPHRSGVYANNQKMRQLLPDAELLPRYFRRHGYWSAGSGKMLHYFIDAPSWDEYFPPKEKEDPFPPHVPWGPRPKSLPRAGDWQYVETDWGAFEVSDEAFGGDYLVTKWIGEQLARPHDQPFFLACGIYRPHEPWFVPQRYFDLFPLDQVQLPAGVKENDLDDVPAVGQRIARNRYLPHIQEHDQWRRGVQAYLASIAYADAMVGRVLAALDRSPHRDNTIVVLWSDHGWHLGEKEHWQKYTGWRVCTRIPLIIRVPAGAPGLLEGTTAGSVCRRPVSLLSLFPTLTALAGLPMKDDNDGPSLVPLLKVPTASWSYVALSHLDQPQNYAISTDDWRYIHYAGGGEELYHIPSDPHEWTNLAGQPEHAGKLQELRSHAPKEIKPRINTTTSNRETRTIQGWTVHISRLLLTDEPMLTAQALELLDRQLEEIIRVVPRSAVTELQKVPLFFSPEYEGIRPRAEYHPSISWLRDHGRDPAMAQAIEFTNVRIFDREVNRMPNFALHELAHAYHDRVLPKGNRNPDVEAAFARAKESGRYDRVERHYGNGKPNAFERSYALSNPMEYFAESTEAYFVRNDFFPFDRAELQQHDPDMADLVARLWNDR